MHILVNLPPAFHEQPAFAEAFAALGGYGELRRSSHNTPEEIAADLAWADAVIMWSWPVLDGQLLDAAGGLRFLGVIDIHPDTARAALERGIPVSLAKRGWSPAVAELALGYLIAALRRMPAHHLAMRHGAEQWGGLWPAGVDARERSLDEVRVGIVGFGGVGRRLRQLLAPFACAVAIHDPYIAPEDASAHDVTALELDELVRTSDALVLCAAANAGTRALIDAERIRALPRDAVLVNVARAGLVDTTALLERLEQGDLTACIDVFDQEPLPTEHPLRRSSGAWLTPHRAGGILASGRRLLAMLTADLAAVQAGAEPAHALRPEGLVALDG